LYMHAISVPDPQIIFLLFLYVNTRSLAGPPYQSPQN